MKIYDKNKIPADSEWYIVSADGKVGPMLWNGHNKFWAGMDGKTRRNAEIDYWINHSDKIAVEPSTAPEKIVIETVAEGFTFEDGNTACISDPLSNDPDKDEGIYVRLCSIDPNGKHDELRRFFDKKLKITIEIL